MRLAESLHVCLAGGDIKSIREAALQQPYSDIPPKDHPVARVGWKGRLLFCATAKTLGP
jgi:hypothetical protein